jgi:hypothetical protein
VSLLLPQSSPHSKITTPDTCTVSPRVCRAIFEKNVDFLRAGRRAVDAPKLINLSMELRKCCNTPLLCRGSSFPGQIVRVSYACRSQSAYDRTGGRHPAARAAQWHHLRLGKAHELVAGGSGS